MSAPALRGGDGRTRRRGHRGRRRRTTAPLAAARARRPRRPRPPPARLVVVDVDDRRLVGRRSPHARTGVRRAIGGRRGHRRRRRAGDRPRHRARHRGAAACRAGRPSRTGSGSSTTTGAPQPTRWPGCSRPGCRVPSDRGRRARSCVGLGRLASSCSRSASRSRATGPPARPTSSRASATRASTTTARDVLAVEHRAGCSCGATSGTTSAGSTPRSPLFRDDLDFGWRAQPPATAWSSSRAPSCATRPRASRGATRRPGPARARAPRPPGRPSGHVGPVLAARRPLPRHLDGALGDRRLRRRCSWPSGPDRPGAS